MINYQIITILLNFRIRLIIIRQHLEENISKPVNSGSVVRFPFLITARKQFGKLRIISLGFYSKKIRLISTKFSCEFS